MRPTRQGLPIALMFLVTLMACGPDAPTDPTDQGAAYGDLAAVSSKLMTGCNATHASPMSDTLKPWKNNLEGEIYGNLYQNGSRFCHEYDPEYMPIAHLAPHTWTGLITSYDSTLQTSAKYRWMWEFWDNTQGTPCDSVTAEVEHESGGGLEGHCVRPGQFTFSMEFLNSESADRSFPVDYLVSVGSNIIDSTPGGSSGFAMAAAPGQSFNPINFKDLAINVDIGTSVSDSAVLDVDASNSPDSEAFTPSANPTAPYTHWFRFGVKRSVPGWTSSDPNVSAFGRFLARLFWSTSPSGPWTAFTNYYDPTAGTNFQMLRKRQFNPSSCPTANRTYYVGVHLMNPTETPQNYPDSESIQALTVTRDCVPAPTAPYNPQASAVTSHSATLSWTNGSTVSGTTTRVEVKPSGGSWTVVAAALAAGVSSTPALGLIPSKSYSIRVRHSLGGQDSDWATANNAFSTEAVPSPSSIGASNVGSTTATINWTNGLTVSGTTTKVEYSHNGVSWTTAHASLSAGTSTANLTGLASNTTYHVRVRHTYQSVLSTGTTASSLFTTTSEPSVTSFEAGVCSLRWSGKWYVDWPVEWTVSGSTSGWSWQINRHTSNNVSGSSLHAYASSGTSTTLSGIQGQSNPIRYYWIRYVNGSSSTAWVALNPTSLDIGDCVN